MPHQHCASLFPPLDAVDFSNPPNGDKGMYVKAAFEIEIGWLGGIRQRIGPSFKHATSVAAIRVSSYRN